MLFLIFSPLLYQLSYPASQGRLLNLALLPMASAEFIRNDCRAHLIFWGKVGGAWFQEPLKIARHFNAGTQNRSNSSPEGTIEESPNSAVPSGLDMQETRSRH